VADRRGRAGLAAILLVAACARPEVGPGPAPARAAPEIRVGIVPGAASVTVGGGVALMLRGPEGGGLIAIPAGEPAVISSTRDGLRVRFSTEDLVTSATLTVEPADSGSPVRLVGREYRGTAMLSSVASGVMLVNVVELEEYMRGVVGAEMGRRSEQDLAALRAQAIVSRTVAMRRAGQWRTRGYDLVATVADQAYAGMGFETPVSDQAVSETAGQVLTFDGRLIDAFFHSTCGGRTADGTEVYAGADRPYLRSIRDQDDAGRAWCAISPRFRWQERWTGEALARTLRETLPAAGAPAQLAGTVRDIQVVDRTPTGRVAHLEVVSDEGNYTVSGPVARLVLRTGDGRMLRSATFNLQVGREGGRIVQLVAEGSGAGHGVGMCQWGALGRARAGLTAEDILSAYFPGTEITRTY
jgi:stage II sporulation protein D